MHALHHRPRHAGRLAAALLLLPALACVEGEGVLGDYTESGDGSDTGSGSADSGSSGAACTEDCDPGFAVTHLSAINFESRAIHLLGDATCDGPSCPPSVSPAPVDGEAIEPCLQTEEAAESPLGPDEYCRVAPAGLEFGLKLGFATPVDRSSFERTRPRPEDAAAEEAYLWYPDVVRLEGPGTALRGDYVHADVDEPDIITAVVNETCAERLTALGIPWTKAELETLCVGTWDDGGVLRPLRMAPDLVFSPYEGRLSTQGGSSCDTPDGGPDTCCSTCDRLLGPGVARYGVSPAGVRRNVNDGTAIPCDPEGDPHVDCRDLVLQVDRGDGQAYTYAWNGAPEQWPLPRYDKIRETHPDDRPAGLEELGAACSSASECADGQDCIGTNAAGEACADGAGCVDRTCRPGWFGACSLETGATGWCVDRRFSSRGAGACLVAASDFAGGMAGDRLSQCDGNEDGLLLEAQCCDPALGGGAGCDPFYQPNLEVLPRYDRHATLPLEAHCACEEGQPGSCADVVDAWCEPPLGTGSDPAPDSLLGDYAVPLVTRLGGVRWDEDTGRLDVRLATIGNVQRADVEACAENRGLIEPRTFHDGWMANAQFVPERVADHDLALCSGSTYRVVLAESDAEHHVRSAGQGTLDGRSEHVFETPQLRIVPNSLFPTDDLMIDSCADFELRLSARHDPSAGNVNKLLLRQGAPDGPLVAGGVGCDPEASPAEVAAGAIPCLTVDAADAALGMLRFSVDEALHGPVLQPGTTYFVVLPGLAEISQMADPEAYAAAFHDACGMPLIVGDTPEELELWELSFTVDEPCP